MVLGKIKRKPSNKKNRNSNAVTSTHPFTKKKEMNATSLNQSYDKGFRNGSLQEKKEKKKHNRPLPPSRRLRPTPLRNKKLSNRAAVLLLLASSLSAFPVPLLSSNSAIALSLHWSPNIPSRHLKFRSA